MGQQSKPIKHPMFIKMVEHFHIFISTTNTCVHMYIIFCVHSKICSKRILRTYKFFQSLPLYKYIMK